MLSEKAMAPHSSTLAWKIPWTKEPGRLQSMGSLRVRHDWATSLSLFTFMHWRRKWWPTPVFLPGESERRGRLVGCRLWGHTELNDWSDLAAAATIHATSVYLRNNVKNAITKLPFKYIYICVYVCILTIFLYWFVACSVKINSWELKKDFLLSIFFFTFKLVWHRVRACYINNHILFNYIKLFFPLLSFHYFPFPPFLSFHQLSNNILRPIHNILI